MTRRSSSYDLFHHPAAHEVNYARLLEAMRNCHAEVLLFMQYCGARNPVLENWQAPSILVLVRAQLAFVNEKDASTIRMEGPSLRLSASHAEYLGLAIHELSTNALKHGALSVPSGKLRIHWSVDKTTNRFQFDWQEFGGPAVAPLERKGFGRIILESVVPATFVRTAELHSPPTGITWHLDAPMTAIISDVQRPIT